MEFRKEVIRPGTYTYINPASRLPEKMTVTVDTIRHLHDNGNAMLRDGLKIPVPLEHQPEAVPQNAAELAAKQLLNNAGFVKGYEIQKDRLYSVLDIPDADIAKKLPSTIRSVSPWITSFTDGNGKKWDGVIGHVALTTRPRIAKQDNFESIGAAMSLLSSLSDKTFDPKSPIPIVLSMDGLLKKDKAGNFKPKHPIAFSFLAGAKLSEDDEIEDEDDDDSEMPKKKEEDAPPVDQFANKDGKGDEDEMGGDVSFEELIPHLLEMHGISVPAGGKGKEFLKALVRGLLASAKTLAAEEELEESTLGDMKQPPGKPSGPVKQETPPMYMSMTQEDIAKIADPKERATAEAFFSLRQESERNKAAAASARKKILDDAAAIRAARVERLVKRLPKASSDILKAEIAAAGASLSLGDDGVISDPLAKTLDMMEKALPDLPELLKASAKDLQLSVLSPPKDDSVMSPERAEELANKMLPRKAS